MYYIGISILLVSCTKTVNSDQPELNIDQIGGDKVVIKAGSPPTLSSVYIYNNFDIAIDVHDENGDYKGTVNPGVTGTFSGIYGFETYSDASKTVMTVKVSTSNYVIQPYMEIIPNSYGFPVVHWLSEYPVKLYKAINTGSYTEVASRGVGEYTWTDYDVIQATSPPYFQTWYKIIEQRPGSTKLLGELSIKTVVSDL